MFKVVVNELVSEEFETFDEAMEYSANFPHTTIFEVEI